MLTEYRDDEDRPAHNIPGLTESDNDVESQDRNLHIRNASESSENGLPIPTAKWIKGPIPPRELRIKPLYPQIQEAPIQWMDKYLPKQRHRLSLLIALYAVWFLIWSLMLKHNSTSAYIEGYGKPSNIWCGASFWFVLPAGYESTELTAI